MKNQAWPPLSRCWQVAEMQTRDRATIRYASYQSEPGQPIALGIVFVNGRGEYIEKYADLPRDLGLPPNCCLVTWDHRGQGGSSGDRSYMDHYDTFARDAALVVAKVLPAGTPYLVLGHSMGGLIALYATMGNYLNPEQMILSSPLLGLPRHPVAPWLAWFLSFTFVGLGAGRRPIRRQAYALPEFSANELTHSREKFARLSSPLFPPSRATFGWVKATLFAQRRVFAPRLVANISVPVVILLAEKETVVDNEKTQQWLRLAEAYSLGSVEHYVVAGANHEILFESDEVYERALAIIRPRIEAWLASHAGPHETAVSRQSI